ncbi:DUF262 domain-containing protein [Nonomuraea sp. MTCD27]|uniref:GmrSD restriction endonuclease domain-containing protein n=1 Tax=Nonomuraea sp. MTCD27 TaxID=1676747 RepID=UPI0035BF123F
MAYKGIIASQMSLKRLFNESFYSIDYYQREYVWGEDEVRALITDLRQGFGPVDARGTHVRPGVESQYFLGPFVYYESARGQRSLVDGQQRFTTLLLMLMRLRSMGIQYEETRHVEILTPLIRSQQRSQARYRVDLWDADRVLKAIFEDRNYEIGQGDSLSVRNIWRRSRDVESLLADISSTSYASFVDWLLEDVILAGIRATDSSNAFRIFESMNDRGARLTSVDLVKSYLLSHVRDNVDKLNQQWRHMLAELAAVQDDRLVASQFLKAVLQGRYARLGDDHDDMREIDAALNLWVRKNDKLLGLLGRTDKFHDFVDELLQLAVRYRTFLEATRVYHKELAELYFNERNGLGLQMVAIFAAVRPEDGPETAKGKARRVAAFLDRWYVLRVLTDLPVQQRDIQKVVESLLPALRRCRTVEDVSAVLAEQIAGEEYEPVNLDGFGLRGTNRSAIKYLLARLTDFVQDGCGQLGDAGDYLDEVNQIEHLYANKPDRHRGEEPDLMKFRSLRNRFGVLVLLPASDNASLGAMPLSEKVTRYGRQNVLVGVLSRDYRENFPDLHVFAKKHDLLSFLRPIKEGATMAQVIELRQELYLRLCARIWSLDRIGVDVSAIPEYRDPFVHVEREELVSLPKLQTDVAKMVRAGVIAPGTRIVLNYRSVDHWAEIRADGRLRLEATGEVFSKVDEAAGFVRNAKTGNGMKQWQIRSSDGRSLSLRDLKEARQSSR